MPLPALLVSFCLIDCRLVRRPQKAYFILSSSLRAGHTAAGRSPVTVVRAAGFHAGFRNLPGRSPEPSRKVSGRSPEGLRRVSGRSSEPSPEGRSGVDHRLPLLSGPRPPTLTTLLQRSVKYLPGASWRQPIAAVGAPPKYLLVLFLIGWPIIAMIHWP